MKVIFIYRRIPHHASHSGYDQLAKNMRCKELSVCFGNLITKAIERLPERRVQPWLRAEVGGWYKKELLAQELQLAINLAIQIPFRKVIYHYLYGEDAFRWGGDIPWKGNNKIVVSFHQPPSIFNDVIKNKNFIASADALIVCGLNQVAYLEQFTKRKNVYYVPHGVDTDYFTPTETRPQKRFNTISVGWWLRDVDMIKKVIQQANNAALDIEFNIVTFPQYFDHYQGLANVNLLSNISDDELKQKYQQADALLLPMKDCTANNAVLEAMACGVPVLTTDVGGIRGYVDESCGFFAKPGDDQALYQALKQLLNDSRRKEQMGIAARNKSLEFCWQVIGGKMMDVYKHIWET